MKASEWMALQQRRCIIPYDYQGAIELILGTILLSAFIIAMVFLWKRWANRKRKKFTMADYQELKALKELLDSGVISEEEYQSERQKIVEKWDRDSA